MDGDPVAGVDAGSLEQRVVSGHVSTAKCGGVASGEPRRPRDEVVVGVGDRDALGERTGCVRLEAEGATVRTDVTVAAPAVTTRPVAE